MSNKYDTIVIVNPLGQTKELYFAEWDPRELEAYIQDHVYRGWTIQTTTTTTLLKREDY